MKTRLGIILFYVFLSGCSEKLTIVSLNLRTVREPEVNDPSSCGRSSVTAEPLSENMYTLRFSFLKRDTAASGQISEGGLRKFSLVCERVVPPQEDIELLIPSFPEGDSPYSILVEAFHGADLRYVGRLEQPDFSQENVQIFLRPTEKRDANSKVSGLSCVDAQREHRAFHTATLLPNGQVLLVGGMVASPSGLYTLDTNSGLAYATGGIEVYDPDHLRFLVVKGDIPPRAFHAAQLLPSPPGGPYNILLIGGITPPSSDKPAFRLRVQDASLPFLVSPHEEATAAPMAVLTYTPSSDINNLTITYQELPDLPRIMYPAIYYRAKDNLLAVAAGADSYTASGTDRGFSGAPTLFFYELQTSADSGGQPLKAKTSTSLANLRVGHSLTLLNNSQLLVLGGTMDGDKASTPAYGELLTWGSKETSTPLTDASVPPVIGHTLTSMANVEQSSQEEFGPAIGALWAGGYSLAYETSHLRLAQTDPQPKALRYLSSGTPPAMLELDSGQTGFQPAGYHAAQRLHDGSVLLSGGNHQCGLSTAFCASNQMVIYALKNGLPEEKTGSPDLQIGRFGHRTTRLFDNTILITGGITLSVTQTQDKTSITPQITNIAEVYNPRNGDLSEDYPFYRSPPLSGSTDINQGTSVCPLFE